MSLEESMLKLAESNLALAEAQNALAEKYERILNGEAVIDPAVVGGATTAKTETPKKGPGRPKKVAEPEPEPEKEDDGLGGEEEEEEADVVTADQLKSALQAFKAAGGAPKDIMSKFGAKAFPEVKEADYAACLAATLKAQAKL